MPVLFSAVGVNCLHCGKSISTLTQAVSEMPEQFEVTCPYCSHIGIYRKGMIHNLLPTMKNASERRSLVIILGSGLLLLVGLAVAGVFNSQH